MSTKQILSDANDKDANGLGGQVAYVDEWPKFWSRDDNRLMTWVARLTALYVVSLFLYLFKFPDVFFLWYRSVSIVVVTSICTYPVARWVHFLVTTGSERWLLRWADHPFKLWERILFRCSAGGLYIAVLSSHWLTFLEEVGFMSPIEHFSLLFWYKNGFMWLSVIAMWVAVGRQRCKVALNGTSTPTFVSVSGKPVAK